MGERMRLAIVHDSLCVSGGAERVALNMIKAFPEATFFTSVYLPEQTFAEFKTIDIHTLPLSKIAQSDRQFKLLYPLWLAELRRMKFKEFDAVLTTSTYLAKYIQPAEHGVHKSYIHAPFRLLWKPESYSDDSLPTPAGLRRLVNLAIPLLRKFDIRETQKITAIAANCQNIANEIHAIYRREARVIHPPVNVEDFPLAQGRGEYFLSVSRLISHKHVDIAIEACNCLGLELIIVGEGPERSRLEKLAGKTIHFVGKVEEQQLHELYCHARALIFPSHEDFGLVPVEAQACGRPVIAFGQGGVLETVKEGVTGNFFAEQSTASLLNCLERFDEARFNPAQIRKWIMQFDFAHFNEQIHDFIETN